MKLHPRVTRSAVELVKRFEGLRRRAARLPDGGWTVGYGHTVSAREGAVVSPEDAEALLYYDLSEVAQKVEAWTFTPLNQNQFEALIAFTFNIGVENFRRSTVLKRVNEGQHLMAAAALELWRKADFGGEDLVIDALVRRRAAEKAHYLTPPEGFRPSPTPVLKPTFDHSVIEAAILSRAGRSAAIVDAPLEGETATATVEHSADAERDGPASSPPIAALTGITTARLHQLFQGKAPEPDAPVQPFALKSEPAEPHVLKAVEGAPSEQAAPLVRDEAPFPALGVPAAPQTDFTLPETGFSGFTPPPVRQFDAQPPIESRSRFAAPASAFPDLQPAPPSLFDAPSSLPVFGASEEPRTLPQADEAPPPPVAAFESHDEIKHLDGAARHKPSSRPYRFFIYSSVGLLGVVLFAAALTSMLSGKATSVNLVIGLIGILLMTPAGGYFLLRFLNSRDGVSGV